MAFEALTSRVPQNPGTLTASDAGATSACPLVAQHFLAQSCVFGRGELVHAPFLGGASTSTSPAYRRTPVAAPAFEGLASRVKSIALVTIEEMKMIGQAVPLQPGLGCFELAECHFPPGFSKDTLQNGIQPVIVAAAGKAQRRFIFDDLDGYHLPDLVPQPPLDHRCGLEQFGLCCASLGPPVSKRWAGCQRLVAEGYGI